MRVFFEMEIAEVIDGKVSVGPRFEFQLNMESVPPLNTSIFFACEAFKNSHENDERYNEGLFAYVTGHNSLTLPCSLSRPGSRLRDEQIGDFRVSLRGEDGDYVLVKHIDLFTDFLVSTGWRLI